MEVTQIGFLVVTRFTQYRNFPAYSIANCSRAGKILLRHQKRKVFWMYEEMLSETTSVCAWLKIADDVVFWASLTQDDC